MKTLDRIEERLKELEGAAEPADIESFGPVVKVNRQFAEVIDSAWKVVSAGNSVGTTPSVFVRGEELVRLVGSGTGVRVSAFRPPSFQEHVGRVADWGVFEKSEKGDEWRLRPVDPPIRVVYAMLETPSPDLPRLERVATVPYFASNGTIVTSPGYHAHEGTFLSLDPSLKLPEVPPVPSDEDVAGAVAMLEEMVCDFRFESDGDKAHYFSLLLEPFTAPLTGKTRPMHVIDAPLAGTGKTLLGHTAAVIATGAGMPWRTFSGDEEERAKAILTALRAGGAFIAFDNVKGTIESSALEAALTSGLFTGRVLGASTEITCTVDSTWVMTANNGQLSPDLARRSVRTRIVSDQEDPTQRSDFKHPKLLDWVTGNRARLIHALLVLVQNWIAEGRPGMKDAKPLASFETWSDVMGGILEVAGVKGFLDDATRTLVTVSDTEEIVDFLEEWAKKFHDSARTAKEILQLIAAPMEFPGEKYIPPQDVTFLPSVLDSRSPGGRSRTLGRWLATNVGRIYGGYRVERAGTDSHKKAPLYKAVRTTIGATKGASSSGATTTPTSATGDTTARVEPRAGMAARTEPQALAGDFPRSEREILERAIASGKFGCKDFREKI